MENITAIIDKIVQYLPVALTVIGAFATIATITPNKTDKIVDVLLKVINFLGANIGNAENKDE